MGKSKKTKRFFAYGSEGQKKEVSLYSERKRLFAYGSEGQEEGHDGSEKIPPKKLLYRVVFGKSKTSFM